MSDAELDEADDTEDRKAAIVRLILAHELTNADQIDIVHAELLGHKCLALRKQAIAIGVPVEALEVADDAADMKTALVELIIGHPGTKESERDVAPQDNLLFMHCPGKQL